MNNRQHKEIRETQLTPEQKFHTARQLALQHLKADFDLGHGMRHNSLVRRDAELREDVTLVRHVVDQIGVVVAINRADPLVHARPNLRIAGREPARPEHLIYVPNDRAGLVQCEIAVPQDRHPLERVQREVRRCVHLGFEVVKGVGDLVMCQDNARHLDIDAAWKAVQHNLGHRCLHAATKPRPWLGTVPPQASARQAGEVQFLGGMPWVTGRLRRPGIEDLCSGFASDPEPNCLHHDCIVPRGVSGSLDSQPMGASLP